MLLNLHVKNLALIDEAEVSFTEGLNILTGETGAGKSIIIGSINFALGEKLNREMIREDCEYALVELVFAVEQEQQREKIASLGYDMEEGQVIFSRKITNGRTISKINGETVSATQLREVSAILINIHGQNEHQSLLQEKNHLQILDEYAREDLAGEKEKLRAAYGAYTAILEKINAKQLDGAARQRELALLEFEINEIEAAQLVPGEDGKLEAEYKRIVNGRKILDSLSEIYACTGYEQDGAAGEQIGKACREMGSVAGFDDRLGRLEAMLTDIDSLLNDFNREVSDYIGGMDFDGEAFYETETRLNLLNQLKSKYSDGIEGILEQLEDKKATLQQYADYDNYMESLRQEREAREKDLEKISNKVSKIRKKYAGILAKEITEALIDLNFLEVSFEMKLKKEENYSANGYDRAEFYISTNPGEKPKPLKNVASGGELSRIMLAVKAVMAEHDDIGTLIFDEIDAGISGRTAQKVSEKMAVIGRGHQIICITHLPQIAAMADSHYLIEKGLKTSKTVSSIRKLKEEEQVAELARMLGGAKITDTVVKNAQEMKDLAASTKKY